MNNVEKYVIGKNEDKKSVKIYIDMTQKYQAIELPNNFLFVFRKFVSFPK